MYNSQLDTFLIVAETGSFASASRRLYISTNAVLQQINNLESRLNVKLFERSNQGLSLTEAGNYLYSEVPHLVAWNSNARERMLQLERGSAAPLRVAIPKMHKLRFFYELWTKYSLLHPEASIEFCTPKSASPEDIHRNYADSDIIEFVKDDVLWQDGKSFLHVCDIPLAFAVPERNILAGRMIIDPAELSGQRVMVHGKHFISKILPYVRQLEQTGAEVIEVPIYNDETLARCLVKNQLILLPYCSKNIHPLLHTVRCSWDAFLPYGFFYSERAANGPDSFIEFAKASISSGSYQADW